MSDQTTERLGVAFGLALMLAVFALVLWPVWGVMKLVFPNVEMGYWNFYVLTLCGFAIVRFLRGPRR